MVICIPWKYVMFGGIMLTFVTSAAMSLVANINTPWWDYVGVGVGVFATAIGGMGVGREGWK